MIKQFYATLTKYFGRSHKQTKCYIYLDKRNSFVKLQTFTNDHDYENFEDLEKQDSGKPSQATEPKKSSGDYYNL